MITSPVPVIPSPSSVTEAVFVTSISGTGSISTSVESSVVFPSVSSPSSEMSVTLLLCPGEDAVTVTLFFTDDV